jgi:hypothetical protein
MILLVGLSVMFVMSIIGSLRHKCHFELVVCLVGRGAEQVGGIRVAGDESQRFTFPAASDEYSTSRKADW